ncbi:hypothetical protein FB451DRAFT_1288553 [Mycena latifolia]|nr:hypothetical protein FB451DRAFT_1288553 [Mycena latifolia]
MHFAHYFSALAVLAVVTVHAAPGPSTTLTKRWCGFQQSCPCEPDPEAGCVLRFDTCSQQWFWPPQCKGCAPCLELCDDVRCDPPNKRRSTSEEWSNGGVEGWSGGGY